MQKYEIILYIKTKFDRIAMIPTKSSEDRLVAKECKEFSTLIVIPEEVLGQTEFAPF